MGERKNKMLHTQQEEQELNEQTYEARRAAREAARTAKPETPKVGDGATYTVWTDSYACTVIEVKKNGKEIVLQRDKATLLNGFNSGEPDALTFTPGGFCGHTEGRQRHSYEADPDGEIIRVSLRKRKNGEWVWKTVGQSTKTPGGIARFGVRAEKYDFNF